MESIKTYDAVFLGAGGAGMLLLDAMHRRGWLNGRNVLVIEPDEKSDNDRTWCFWTDGNDALIKAHEDVVSHQWNLVENGLGRLDELKPYRYAQIRSMDFYYKIKSAIKSHPSITWLAAAGEIKACDGETTTVQAGENNFFGKIIFDSRPFSPAEAAEIMQRGDWMWQSFVGYRVKTSGSFDAQTCTLMDFNILQNGASQFVYTLPTSHNEALIELTRFGKSCLTHEEAELVLSEYIGEKAGTYEILEVETGRIPMTMALNPEQKFHPASQRIVPIGTRAGAVKSTTGYAFKFMAQHAEKIVDALFAETPFPTAYHRKRLAFYDKILMRVLAMEPQIGKKVFQQLFKKRQTREVLRFLDEETNFWQEIRILSILPYRPFLKALFQLSAAATPNSFVNEEMIRKPRFIPHDGAVIAIAFILVLINSLSPDLIAKSAPWILLAGLVFPGIPHGAVDHWVALGKKLYWGELLGFVSKYVLIMAVIALMWWFSSTAGLLLFLAYSAWHFGETDLRDWKTYTPGRTWIWGVSILGTLLFGHFEALYPFFTAYGSETIYDATAPYSSLLLYVSIVGLFISGWFQRSNGLRQWALTTTILLLGLALPLLLAFALYFVGCHSFRGWRHLREELKANQSEMLLKALPFSIGAWTMAGILILSIHMLGFAIGNLWPFAFIFIAAISGPHVYIMHRMYSAKSNG